MMRKLPKEMQQFVNVALRSDNWKDAYQATRSIKGVSPKTAEWFRKEYGANSASMEDAFKQFYDDVRGGQYVMEGELERIKQIIKEELLKEALEDYITAYKNFDVHYMMSDDPRAYNNGKAQERKIKDIYNSLSDHEKRQAAIWFRDYFVEKGLFPGSETNRNVNRWRPEQDFDPDTFDGTYYRGI